MATKLKPPAKAKPAAAKKITRRPKRDELFEGIDDPPETIKKIVGSQRKKKPVQEKKPRPPPPVETDPDVIARRKAPREITRNSVYRPEYVDIARRAYEMGATAWDVAKLLNVTENTLWRWSITKPDFHKAVQVGKEAANQRVIQSLYKKATGYTHRVTKTFLGAESDECEVTNDDGSREVTRKKRSRVIRVKATEHIPPSDQAMIFWLTNRLPKDWSRAPGPEGGLHDGDNGSDAVANLEALITAAEK